MNPFQVWNPTQGVWEEADNLSLHLVNPLVEGYPATSVGPFALAATNARGEELVIVMPDGEGLFVPPKE